MTNTAARAHVLTQLEVERFDAETERLHQAALAGARGVQAQLVAMSAQYHALRAAGDLDAAAAIKARAYALVGQTPPSPSGAPLGDGGPTD